MPDQPPAPRTEEHPPPASSAQADQHENDAPRRPRVSIEYCTQCRWLLRAAWMGQELLTSLGEHIGELTLIPGSGGVFRVRVNGQLIWCREQHGGMPDIKELKRRVRDRIAPDKHLGHTEQRH